MNLTFRIGHGYDIHRFERGKPLILGGTLIPYPSGLKAHSDGDCISHALADAILGALALPDIGHYFPPTELKWKGINSQEILKKTIEEAKNLGYVVAQIDLTVVAEKPMLGPYTNEIKKNLSKTLNLDINCIGLKSKTHEGLGAIGRGEAIACYAVCVVEKIK